MFSLMYPNVPGTRITFAIDQDGTLELKRLNFDLGGAPSVGSCTGLGTGSCSLATGSSDSNGNIVLSPTGLPSSDSALGKSGTNSQHGPGEKSRVAGQWRGWPHPCWPVK